MFDILKDELLARPSMPFAILAVRLGGALLLCGIIGWERETAKRPAGLRTHMLLGLGAAVYCLLMLELVDRMVDYPEGVRLDPVRIVEAVTSGVAFLAAGMIVFAKGKVRGLTTGAGMWLAASVGLACGLGMWPLAVTTSILALIINRVVRTAEDKEPYEEKERRY